MLELTGGDAAQLRHASDHVLQNSDSDIELKLGLHRLQVGLVQGFKGYTDTLKYLGPHTDGFSMIMSHTTLQRMEASEDCAFDVL